MTKMSARVIYNLSSLSFSLSPLGLSPLALSPLALSFSLSLSLSLSISPLSLSLSLSLSLFPSLPPLSLSSHVSLSSCITLFSIIVLLAFLFSHYLPFLRVYRHIIHAYIIIFSYKNYEHKFLGNINIKNSLLLKST